MNVRALRALERLAACGNRLPDPVTLFALLALGVVALSAALEGSQAEIVQKDGTAALHAVRSLAGAEGVRWMFENAVANFAAFPPLAKVLVVMLGIGVAERSGLVALALRRMVDAVPGSLVAAALVFAGVMSSMAADAGYVVLTPLGAALFAGLGRHPLAGLAAAFAGVSGGYSANLLITSVDPMLAGLTQQGARLIDPDYSVLATANWFFMSVSTFAITAVGTLVTTRIVEPLLGPWDPSRAEGPAESLGEVGAAERRGFRAALVAAALVLCAIAWLALSDRSPLREPSAGRPAIEALGPFFRSIEVLVAALFFAPGVAYGVFRGKLRSDKDVGAMLADSMSSMGAYIALAFVAAQFVAFFGWTNLGAVLAVRGAEALRAVGLDGLPLLLAFVLLTGLLDLLVGSASAKWAFMAPIFVPMLMLAGFSPESVQAAYRVGDSVANVVSPLLPYLPIIIVFARRYDREAGLGTLLAAMLPYALSFGVVWTALLLGWIALGIPLGPGAPTLYP
jgi:aminobenzoyl-glutamate transport protein